MNSKHMKATLAVASLLLVTSIDPRAGALPPTGPPRLLTVMTQNVYRGVDAEISAVPGATSQADLLARVGAVYNGYFVRNFPERAAAMANEILLSRPDLIGLQEAILVRTQEPADGPATPATRVELDYVQILLDALAARGVPYTVVTQSIGFDIELPGAIAPNRIVDVRHTDREVLLARADLRLGGVTLSNPQDGHFQANCVLPTLSLRNVAFPHGWVSVDATAAGRTVRVVSTHLDAECLPFTTAVQEAQAAEILTGPAATDLPVVLLGDLNSPADGTGVSFNMLTGTTGRFADVWTSAGFGIGLTCCQAADLRNSGSTLTERSDLVLFRGQLAPLVAFTVGDRPIFKTRSGMWPSDHAGVGAVLLAR